MPHKDDQQNNVALRRRNNEIDVKITYFLGANRVSSARNCGD